jgi:uncharacterized protein YbbC (DUF1343 family)
VQILFTDRDQVHLTGIQFQVMDAVQQAYPDRQLFGQKRDAMFDKVCGTEQIRRMFLERRPLSEILAFWNQGIEDFRAKRAKYLLYD